VSLVHHEVSALDRKIAEQTRLLLQLKSKRSLWGSKSEIGGSEAGATSSGEAFHPRSRFPASPKPFRYGRAGFSLFAPQFLKQKPLLACGKNPKWPNEAVKSHGINGLTSETKPNEANSEAAKSFRIDPALERTQKRTR
jgi:hypothetical protein